MAGNIIRAEARYNSTSNLLKNQVYNFFIGNYLLKLNNSSLKREFNSDSDSSVELDLFFHKNKVNRLKKSGKNKGK